MVQTGFSKERGIQLGESRRQGFLADVKKQQGHGRRGGQRVRAWGRVVRTWGPPSLLVPELRHGQTSFRVLGGGSDMGGPAGGAPGCRQRRPGRRGLMRELSQAGPRDFSGSSPDSAQGHVEASLWDCVASVSSAGCWGLHSSSWLEPVPPWARPQRAFLLRPSRPDLSL